ncbi:MAG: tandem-95 repeat protein, partial [candidate division Zixibacteria bacterium]|nr:tandem-95 repeat protein [candidate division Zixibacteria bacterium]
MQSGSYNVTFYATDDSTAVDSEIVTITVTDAGNQPPILASIGAQSTTENVLLSFGVSATDIESTPALTTSTLPTGAVFIDNGNGTGSFDWTPDFLQSGSYDVTFYATDDSSAVDSEVVTITVNDAGNQLPVLTSIGAQSTTENVLLSFGVSAIDIESTPVLTTSSLPTGASFIDNGNGSGSFDWTPDLTQAGIYNVTFYATDDSSAVDSEVVTITVNDAGNQQPILAAIGAQSVDENANLNFGVSATDADGTTPTLSTSALPTGASFTDNGNGTGSFDWTPTFVQSGVYSVTFYATDGIATDSEIVAITVNNVNQAPILAAIGNKTVDEGQNLNFTVTASDADGTAPTLTTSSLPAGATFVDSGNGTGSFDWTPDFLQSGTYNVTFYATDDSSSIDSEVVTITVNEAGNQQPILAAIGAQSTNEGVNLNFGVSATDAESTPSLTTSTLPTGASFTDNGNGTGTFDWTPDLTQAGTYNVTFYATDDSSAVDSEIVTITVNDAGNLPPVLNPIGAQSTTENVLLSFGVSATDIESTPVLTTSALPTGAVFIDNGNGTGDFDWTPTFLQSGSYNVTFYATDDSTAVDSEIVTITVNDGGNQAPVLAIIGAQSTTENVVLTFGVSATDIESIPSLTATGLPTGASFTDNADGTGSFSWTPDFLQSGTYNVTFTGTDDSSATDFEIVTITVIEAGNQLPVLAAIGAQSTTENVNLAFGVSATDIESIPSLTATGLPTGASFTDNLDGTGSFSWTPDFLQSGTYNVTFTATDDSSATDFEVVTITVTDAGNQLPVLDPIGSKFITEADNLNFNVSATDAESTPTLTATNLPTGATFVDNGDGTGVFDWTPDFTQSGTYNITFYAADDSTAVDSEVVTITVNEAGNQLPILAAIGAQSTTENILLSFGVSATDIESTPTLTTSVLPTGAVFTDKG